MKYLLCVILLFAGSLTVLAQKNPALPDLAPQVVEITGDLSISFPSLDRQPLVGFNPPPRVPEIPSDRRPFVELYKQTTGELPPSPLDPPRAPDVSPLANRTAHQSQIEGGLGRYLERFVRANMSVPLNPQTGLIISGAYRGTDGHEPFASLNNVSTSSEGGFIGARLHHSTGGLELGGGFQTYGTSYSLFGTEHLSASPLAINPDRSRGGWQLQGQLGTTASSRFDAGFALAVAEDRVTSDLFNAGSGAVGELEQKESLFEASGHIDIPVREYPVSIEGRLSRSKLDTLEGGDDDLFSGEIAGRLQLQPGNNMTIDVGLSVFGFDAPGQTSLGLDRSLVFMSPEFSLRYELQPGTRFNLSNRPSMTSGSLKDMYYLAPYAKAGAPLQPLVSPVNLRAGVDWYSEFIHVEVGFGVKQLENYRVVEFPSSPISGFARGYFDVSYEKASVTYLEGAITASISPGIQANADVAFRRGRLDKNDAVIPHFSPVSFGAALALGLMDGRITLTLSARGESARHRDREKTLEIASFLILDTEATWYLTPQAGLLFGIRSLGNNTEFWDNYERESSVVYVGGKWRW